MWNCEGCSEAIEDNFEVCRVCGTARDGTSNPSFKPEGSGDRQENPVHDPTVHRLLKDCFHDNHLLVSRMMPSQSDGA